MNFYLSRGLVKDKITMSLITVQKEVYV